MSGLASGFHSLLQRWRSWRFLQLLIVMLAVLLLEPLKATHPVMMVTMHLLLLDGLLVSLSAAGFAPRMQWAFFAAWLLSVMLEVLAVRTADPAFTDQLYLWGKMAVMALLAGCVAAMLRYVLRSRQVSVDSISAAAVAYLFIGIAFAAAYQALLAIDARSFAIPSDMVVTGRADLEVAMLYYSYVTLATLGYGDIAPRLPLAQMVAVLEAILGQFYIAVVIAWLVSVYAAGRSALSSRDDGRE
jgi:hypothetical protein